jgi:hypothetical protein
MSVFKRLFRELLRIDATHGVVVGGKFGDLARKLKRYGALALNDCD